jgi:4-hydroxybenzoyl-CoA thioesterase
VTPLDRPIKFEDVDAAGIVFFARFVTYAHEAMEHFFAPLEGGYARLILERRVGFPAVHVDMSFTAPARYGDVLRIETRVKKVGNRSVVFQYRMFLVGNGALSAEVTHTVVVSDLRTITSCDMPADVRALLLAHLEP